MKKLTSFHDFGCVDVSIIDAFSKCLNVSLPVTYIALLSKYNALSPVKSYVDYIDANGNFDSRCIQFYGYNYSKIEVFDADDLQLFQSSIKETNAIELRQPDEYSYHGVVAIGATAEGDHICFDYRQEPSTDNPSVVLMYHDQFIRDEHGTPKMAVVKIADDFDSFIEMLHD